MNRTDHTELVQLESYSYLASSLRPPVVLLLNADGSLQTSIKREILVEEISSAAMTMHEYN